MSIIIGLGNPGEKYEKSRHNAGFIFLDRLAAEFNKEHAQTENKWQLSDKFDAWHQKFTLSSTTLYMLKPTTYMNESGKALIKFLKWIKADKTETITAVYDDLDLPLGEYKIGEKYPQSHNGIKSLVETVGDGAFLSIRIGTDNRESRNANGSGRDFVLEEMSEDEMVLLYRAIDSAIIAFKKDYLQK
jgi:peptidyl-tRNA hydrolase, PTH1 family